MKKLKMILTGILMISMLFHLSLFSVFAAEEYTYTVTFYAGNRGTFTGVDGLSVVSTGEVQIDHQGDKVVVGGLKAGDTLSFDLQQGTVRSPTSSVRSRMWEAARTRFSCSGA